MPEQFFELMADSGNHVGHNVQKEDDDKNVDLKEGSEYTGGQSADLEHDGEYTTTAFFTDDFAGKSQVLWDSCGQM